MTAQQAKSWIDRITPSSWITIIIVVGGIIVSLAISGYQSEEDKKQIKENTKAIQDLEGDYKVIIERLNQSKETDLRMERKLDELLRDK